MRNSSPAKQNTLCCLGTPDSKDILGTRTMFLQPHGGHWLCHLISWASQLDYEWIAA